MMADMILFTVKFLGFIALAAVLACCPQCSGG